MKHSENIQNELKEISPLLADIEKVNVYTIPANYFQELPKEVLEKARTITSLLPAADANNFASETHFFTVPDGYFDNLSANILKKIKSLETDKAAEELKELSPMLYAAQSVNVFSVPAGYFEALPGIVLNATKPPQAKIILFNKRSAFWKLAAAAIFTGVMAVSALWVTNRSFKATPAKTSNIPSFVSEADQFKDAKLLNKGIASLSDDEIIKYLEVTGTYADNDILATIVPEKELPAEQDYLLDENTLDTYLEGIKEKNNKN